ncbi:MAG: SMC-Scp complex subunit ScpB [Acidobacteriota bacterium]
MLTGVLHNQILAILFSARDPVKLSQLEMIFPDVEPENLQSVLNELMSGFNSMQNAVEIRRIAGGYRITSLPEQHEILMDYLRSKPSARLTQAALETLAVIAYKQPVTSPEISEIRSVKGSSTLKTLLEKRLIEIRGRKKVIGRPILYGTSQEFLVHFGLNDLSELPSLEEFEEIVSDGVLVPPDGVTGERSGRLSREVLREVKKVDL